MDGKSKEKGARLIWREKGSHLRGRPFGQRADSRFKRSAIAAGEAFGVRRLQAPLWFAAGDVPLEMTIGRHTVTNPALPSVVSTQADVMRPCTCASCTI